MGALRRSTPVVGGASWPVRSGAWAVRAPNVGFVAADGTGGRDVELGIRRRAGGAMATEAFEEPMVAVHDYATDVDARHVAALLVEHGVGAAVEPIPADELPDEGPSDGYRVLVLAHELVRAEELLGLREAQHAELADP